MWDSAIGVLLYYRLRASKLIILSQGDHLIIDTWFSNSIITWRNQIRDLKTFFFFLTMFCTLLGKGNRVYCFTDLNTEEFKRIQEMIDTCKKPVRQSLL